MSVYIKGEEFYKPTACAPCKIRQWCQLWKQVTLPAHIVHPECPIIEVPDHEGPLVDALDIINAFPDEYVFTNAQAKALTNYIIPADKEGEE